MRLLLTLALAACGGASQTAAQTSTQATSWVDAIRNVEQALATGADDDAEQALTDARALAVEYDDDRRLYTKQILERLGAFYAERNRIEEADIRTAQGRLREAAGRFGAAESSYRRALEVRSALLGPDHLKAADSMVDLATVYGRSKSFADRDAPAFFRRALGIRERIVGMDDPLVANTLERLARSLRSRDKVDEAEPLEVRATQIRKRSVRELTARLTPSSNPDEPALRISDGVSAPRLLSKTEPEYSEEARQLRHQGVVALAIEIDTEGRPRAIELHRSLGLGLDEKAAEAVAQWRFQPGTKDDKPVPVKATVEIHFRLL